MKAGIRLIQIFFTGAVKKVYGQYINYRPAFTVNNQYRTTFLGYQTQTLDLHIDYRPANQSITNWRASEASETLSGLNNENWRYMLFTCIYIYIYIYLLHRLAKWTNQIIEILLYFASERSKRDTIKSK